MVVDDDYAIPEVCLLGESAADRVGDGARPVEYRDYDRSLEEEFSLLSRDRLEWSVHKGPYAAEITGADGFAFDLDVAIARIDIVELLFAGLAEVAGGLGVKHLVDMDNLPESQAQVVEGAVLQVGHRFGGRLQAGGPYEPERSEIEVVTEGSLLAVDQGMADFFSIATFVDVQVPMVGIDHVSAGIIGNFGHPLEGEIAEIELSIFRIEKYIPSSGRGGDFLQD